MPDVALAPGVVVVLRVVAEPGVVLELDAALALGVVVRYAVSVLGVEPVLDVALVPGAVVPCVAQEPGVVQGHYALLYAIEPYVQVR